MVLTINQTLLKIIVHSSKQMIAIVEVYHTISICNNNACHLRTIIKPQTYVAEYMFFINVILVWFKSLS